MGFEELAPYAGGGGVGIAVMFYAREALNKLTSIDKNLAVYIAKHDSLVGRVDKLEKKIENNQYSKPVNSRSL